ncbi:MAG: hypothetical protein WDZ48_09670 [Pirellulales bacterium]
MRLDATSRGAKHETPLTQGRPSPGHDLPALVARFQRLARSQPTAVLGVLEYWLGPHVENDRVDLEA